MITWIVEVYLLGNHEVPIKKGYIEKPSQEAAVAAASATLDDETMSVARIEVRPLSIAPTDQVLWI